MKEAGPGNRSCIGFVMSNFDHEIDADAEDRLRIDNIYGEYAAWNFFAKVWYEDDKFKAQIFQYNVHINTIESDTLRGIMDEASELYGAA